MIAKKIIIFFKSLKKAFYILNQPSDKLIFFSEGSQDWIHFDQILLSLLKKNYKVIYISMNKDDPGLNLVDKNFESFTINSESVLNILFKNISCNSIFMTMTDLNTFFLKRSHHKNVKYYYFFHSINSTHAVYLEKAFDAYDYIFLVGPKHKQELIKSFNLRKIKQPIFFSHGSEKLDKIIKESRYHPPLKNNRVLIGFSWGENSISENINKMALITKKLISQDYQVTIRPHPMTLKRIPGYFEKIKNKLPPEIHNFIEFDCNFSSNNSIFESIFLVTDWSGLSFEFAFGLKRPVLFIDSLQKIRNNNWKLINMPLLEDKIRSEIGIIISEEQIDFLDEYLPKLLQTRDYENISKKYVYNIGNATQAAVNSIIGELS